MSEALDFPLDKERRRAQLDLVSDSDPTQLSDGNLDEVDGEEDSLVADEATEQSDGFETDEDVETYRKARKDAELVHTTDQVRAYLKAIGKVPLLNAAEEVDLSKRIEAGLYAEKKLQLLKAAGVGRKAVIAELGTVIDGNNNEVSRPDIAQAIVTNTKGRRDPEAQTVMIRELRWVERDGEKAKDHLIRANLRLVVSLAKRYTGNDLSFMDLIQEGNGGLIRAVEKFDYTKGYKFSTYATWWIRQAITRALADQSRTIRVPVHMVEQLNKLGRIEKELLQTMGRNPSIAEIAKEMDLDETKVNDLRDVRRMQPVSLDQPIGDGGGVGPGQTETYLGDLIADERSETAVDATARVMLRDQLRNVLDTLSEREATVMKLRYGLVDGNPRTLDEIGQIFDLSRERIRQIERDVMVKLRHPSRKQILQDYLD